MPQRESSTQSLHALLEGRLAGTLAAMAFLRDHLDEIVTVVEIIRARMLDGATMFTCGNGGSAAEALHLAEELIGRYRDDRAPIPAICLNADPTGITCIANDYGFEEIFARPVRALVRPDDILIVFSTSGNSENINRALDAARANGAMTIGFLGKTGGAALARCDHAITVPGADSAAIQEAHQVVMHLLCEALEAGNRE